VRGQQLLKRERRISYRCLSLLQSKIKQKEIRLKKKGEVKNLLKGKKETLQLMHSSTQKSQGGRNQGRRGVMKRGSSYSRGKEDDERFQRFSHNGKKKQEEGGGSFREELTSTGSSSKGEGEEGSASILYTGRVPPSSMVVDRNGGEHL